MEHGPIKVLLQPAEIIIIGGAALGTVLISMASPPICSINVWTSS